MRFLVKKFKLFNYLGTPVYAHISTLLVFLYFYLKYGMIGCIVSGPFFILLMIAHEMGHAFFVKKYNHELIDIRIYPIHGVCNYQYDTRWLPETLIIAGGLLAQLIVLVFWLAVLGYLNVFELTTVKHYLKPVTRVLIDINIIVLFINSLPISGLDGFELWKRLFSYLKEKLKNLLKKSKIKQKTQPKQLKDSLSSEKVVDLAIKRAQKNDNK